MKPLQFLIHPDFTNGGSPLKGWKKADDIFKSLGHIAVWNINCSKNPIRVPKSVVRPLNALLV